MSPYTQILSWVGRNGLGFVQHVQGVNCFTDGFKFNDEVGFGAYSKDLNLSIER